MEKEEEEEKAFLNEEVVRKECPGTIKTHKGNYKHYLTEIETEGGEIEQVCLIKECSHFRGEEENVI